MIPLLAVVHVRTPYRRPIRLWLPLFLIWLLLALPGLLLSPLILVACLIARLNPFLTIWSLARVFAALAGTDIEVQSHGAAVVVRVI